MGDCIKRLFRPRQSRLSIIQANIRQPQNSQLERRPHSLRTHPITAVTLLANALPALAQQTNCATNPHDSSCVFDSTLHLLHWLAILLAIILIAIIAVAIAAYRKNKRAKLTPDD